jgi:Skp family chaperone for outer membrane proteins
MNQQTTTAGQGMGIAGLILGIIAIPLAIIPCTIILALFFGTAGIVLSAVGLHQANTANGTKGLPVSGLIVSIVGLSIAFMWGLLFASFTDHGKPWRQGKFWEQFEKIGNEVGKDIEESMKDIEDELEEAGKELEETGEDLEKTLEDLESDSSRQNFIWDDKISDGEFDDLIDTYEELIDEYIDLVDEAGKGIVDATDEFEKISAKANALAAKLTAVAVKLTKEQKAKFEELRKKFEEALKETRQ